MRVPALLSSVRLSRQWSVREARAHGASDATARVVELLTSEVVTNAVKYGHVTGSIDMSLERTEGALTFSVGDDNPAPPEVLDGTATRVGGQGLRVVAHLAQAWGWCPTRQGKRVWFTVALV